MAMLQGRALSFPYATRAWDPPRSLGNSMFLAASPKEMFYIINHGPVFPKPPPTGQSLLASCDFLNSLGDLPLTCYLSYLYPRIKERGISFFKWLFYWHQQIPKHSDGIVLSDANSTEKGDNVFKDVVMLMKRVDWSQKNDVLCFLTLKTQKYKNFVVLQNLCQFFCSAD